MSGSDAVRRLLEACDREEFVAADLVARALTLSKRRMLRDWRAKKHPITNVGRAVLLSSALVLHVYFPHRGGNSPATDDHSDH